MPRLKGTEDTKTFTKTGEMALKELLARPEHYKKMDEMEDQYLDNRDIKMGEGYRKDREEAREELSKVLEDIALRGRVDSEDYEKELLLKALEMKKQKAEQEQVEEIDPNKEKVDNLLFKRPAISKETFDEAMEWSEGTAVREAEMEALKKMLGK